MRPYAGSSSLDEKKSVYNYRHSRARRVIENAFGILLARWRIYNTPIQAKPENVEKIVLATIALHNYLRQTDNTSYCPNGFIDCERSTSEIIPGHWRRDSTAATSNDENLHGAVNIGLMKGCRPDDDALLMRNCLME